MPRKAIGKQHVYPLTAVSIEVHCTWLSPPGCRTGPALIDLRCVWSMVILSGVMSHLIGLEVQQCWGRVSRPAT